MGVVKRFDVVFADFAGARGREMRKPRPCVVVSPDDLNARLKTVIVLPLTSTLRGYPFRVPCTVKGRKGEIAVDQIRTIDRRRITSRLATLSRSTSDRTLRVLAELFGP